MTRVEGMSRGIECRGSEKMNESRIENLSLSSIHSYFVSHSTCVLCLFHFDIPIPLGPRLLPLDTRHSTLGPPTPLRD